MDMKNCIELVITKGDNVYRFNMPAGAPFGELYDAAFEILNKIVQFAQEAAKKAAPQEIAEPTQDN